MQAIKQLAPDDRADEQSRSHLLQSFIGNRHDVDISTQSKIAVILDLRRSRPIGENERVHGGDLNLGPAGVYSQWCKECLFHIRSGFIEASHSAPRDQVFSCTNKAR